jgi:hypothetical protein
MISCGNRSQTEYMNFLKCRTQVALAHELISVDRSEIGQWRQKLGSRPTFSEHLEWSIVR